jgi:hypothetical protein
MQSWQSQSYQAIINVYKNSDELQHYSKGNFAPDKSSVNAKIDKETSILNI